MHFPAKPRREGGERSRGEIPAQGCAWHSLFANMILTVKEYGDEQETGQAASKY
jgi:hypothetical protein